MNRMIVAAIALAVVAFALRAASPRAAFAFLAASLDAGSAAAETLAATIALTTRPSPLGVGQNLFEVTLKDAKGQPMTNADVSIVLLMPADPKTKHPEMKSEGKLNNVGKGKYNGIAMVTMAGDWTVTVTASQNGKQLARKTEKMTAHLTRPRPAPTK
jgi:nitrogen fixation protein FixH